MSEKKEIPKYVEMDGLYYPLTRVRSVITHLGGGVLHSIVDTSKNPVSVVRRLEAIKQDPNFKQRLWKQASEMLKRSGEGKTKAELIIQEKDGFDFVNLD